MIELELFHNKAIFDAFNEALDASRPYGQKGVPYSWKANQPYKPAPILEKDMDDVLERTREKVLLWCAYVCGYLGNGEEIFGPGFGSLSEEHLLQIKEERLARMLAQEVANLFEISFDSFFLLGL